MSRLDLTGCKKRKRGERPLLRFKSFGEPGHPVEFSGHFRENIKSLLECGNMERDLCSGMPSISFQLEIHRQPPLHVFLFVIEESLEASLHPYCKHCQYIGWGHHMICKKKYHFLLPSKQTMATCVSCEGNCKELDFQKGKCNLIELEGHVMHGVFHSNGFGHLLCVNGIEMGSNLAGNEIMDFWDRLCIGLQARRVSLSDISQKRGMEWRLLHGVAYGKPWFARWGYKFGRGSYGITHEMYQKAIEAIQAMPLSFLLHHLDNPTLISKYQSLSTPTQSLTTIKDLFHFMLELKSHLPRKAQLHNKDPCNNLDPTLCSSGPETTTCRWSPKRVEMAARVIVEALRRAEFRWVSRQQVRDAARAYIGDTGLLDYVLKSLGNHVVGNFLVRRSLNPVTKVLEYSLVDISCIAFDPMAAAKVPNGQHSITRTQLMKDLLYFYKCIFFGNQKAKQNGAVLTAMSVAARIILDTKHLIKEYYDENYHQNRQISRSNPSNQQENFEIYCTIQVKIKGETDESVSRIDTQPYECIVLRDERATIDDLKREVEERFGETYCGLRGFAAESIANLSGVEGTKLVSAAVAAGSKLVFEGIVAGGGGEEGILWEGSGGGGGGARGLAVECRCGAGEDDGERMICCDICEVWQHSRCVGFPNTEEIPIMFLCNRCEQEIAILPSLS